MKLIQTIINKFLIIIARQIRYIKFAKYQKKYNFNKWHMIPIIGKPYVREIINYIKKTSSLDENICIVECGCGLCDILSNKSFTKCELVGVEKDKNVFDADNEIYREQKISFINGSFQDIKYMDIDWFIAVNFTHEMPSNEMSDILMQLCSDNYIKYIILDEVTGNYKYHHNYAALMPLNYVLKDTLGPYLSDGGNRYIVIFENSNLV